jgi:hypothetical protein
MAVLSIIRGKCADFRAKMVEHSAVAHFGGLLLACFE